MMKVVKCGMRREMQRSCSKGVNIVVPVAPIPAPAPHVRTPHTLHPRIPSTSHNACQCSDKPRHPLSFLPFLTHTVAHPPAPTRHCSAPTPPPLHQSWLWPEPSLWDSTPLSGWSAYGTGPVSPSSTTAAAAELVVAAVAGVVLVATAGAAGAAGAAVQRMPMRGPAPRGVAGGGSRCALSCRRCSSPACRLDDGIGNRGQMRHACDRVVEKWIPMGKGGGAGGTVACGLPANDGLRRESRLKPVRCHPSNNDIRI